MAKMTIGSGLQAFISGSDELKYRAPEIIGRCMYPGAGILADALKAQISALPVDDGNNKKKGRRNPTQAEKDGLISGMGIAKKRTSGDTSDITIGFDGYNGNATPKYPRGQANAMIANAINAGTTFRNRIPFKKAAVSAASAAAEAAMIAEAEKLIKEIID